MRWAKQSAISRWPAFSWILKWSITSPSVRPLTTEPKANSGAFSSTTFAPASVVSSSRPTAKARGFDAPKRPTTRTSYMPGGVSGAMVTLNLLSTSVSRFSKSSCCVCCAAVIPGCENNKREASSSEAPPITTSNVDPALPPAGERVVRFVTGNCARATDAGSNNAAPNKAMTNIALDDNHKGAVNGQHEAAAILGEKPILEERLCCIAKDPEPEGRRAGVSMVGGGASCSLNDSLKPTRRAGNSILLTARERCG